MTERESDIFYGALKARDKRFDGKFFTAVRTTGVYCRPVCPAKTPLRRNVIFFRTAAAASAAGFRPCLRCRPETSPGSPAWAGTAAVVTRAWRLLGEIATDAELGPEDLAKRLGLGDRQVRRLFKQHLGASPHVLLQMRRLDFARRLLEETRLSVTDVALASGFHSIRRFNAVYRERFKRTPSESRRSPTAVDSGTIAVRMPYRGPYDWESLVGFLRGRAIPGVEAVVDGIYRRVITIDGHCGTIEIAHRPQQDCLLLSIRNIPPERLMAVVERAKRCFDVDMDPEKIATHLSADKYLAPLLRKNPGLRVPIAWDRFELLVRAIVGQQVSVAGARTLLGRLVARLGAPVAGGGALSLAFPTAAALADGELSGLGITGARIGTIKAVASAVAAGKLRLDEPVEENELRRQLLDIPGIGNWTVDYLALRGLGNPDAFPATDLVIRREILASGANPERWSPWRAYAVLHLWKAAERRIAERSISERSISERK